MGYPFLRTKKHNGCGLLRGLLFLTNILVNKANKAKNTTFTIIDLGGGVRRNRGLLASLLPHPPAYC